MGLGHTRPGPVRMNDIQKQNRRLFTRELFRSDRVFWVAALLLLTGLLFRTHGFGLHNIWTPILGWLLILTIWIGTSSAAAAKKRFYNSRFEALWKGCQDRLARFEEVLGKMRREQVADLHEMPKTIRRVGENLYAALRRADMIAYEVQKTERGVLASPPAWQSPSEDPQAKELYRLADKNIAEYRMQFAGVMAGVHRAEAQSAVYMTTLDTLRMKMIGYRLVGKNPEMNSQDFLEALGEAKLQLHAIDQALEELDFSVLPRMIAAVPPATAEDLHLQQGN